MKTGMKQILSALVFLSALTGCKIEDPDFFVREVAFAAAEKEVVFEPAGGTESFSVEANCDWSVSCPAERVTFTLVPAVCPTEASASLRAVRSREFGIFSPGCPSMS